MNVYHKSAFFNPKFKDHEDKKVYNRLKNETRTLNINLTKLFKKRSTDYPLCLKPNKRQIQIIDKKFSAYLSVSTCYHVDKVPLLWWKINESKFPHIAVLVNKYLSVQETSVGSGRLAHSINI